MSSLFKRHAYSDYQANKRPRLSPSSTYSEPVTTLPPPPGLTLQNATETLQRYLGWLRNKPQDGLSFQFEESTQNPRVQYAIAILPKNTNVRNRRIKSDAPFANQAIAKKNASFHAVCALYAVGEIDSDLMPTPATPAKPGPPPSALKLLGIGPDAGTSSRPWDLDSTGRAEYSTTLESARPQEASGNVARELLGHKQSTGEHEMLAHPSYWHTQPPFTTTVFASIITIEFTRRPDLEGLCRRVCIVTSQPLPFGKEITLGLADYSTSNFRVVPTVRLGRSEALHLSDRELDTAFEWTRKLTRSLTNQPIDGLLEKAAYLFLPLKPKFEGDTCTVHDIAWDEVYLVDEPVARELDLRDNQRLASSLEDAVLCTAYELGRRHYVLRIRSDLNPYSPAPRRQDVSILDLTKGQGDFPMARLQFHEQPIVESEHVLCAPHGGWLTTLNQPKPLQHLIPELLYLHFVSASVMRTSTFIPNIMAALDEHLIAVECDNEVFGGKLNVKLVQQAITSPAVRPAPHNYQRLEMLGEAVLHFVASVDVFRHFEPREDGELRKARHLLVSNRALLSATTEADVIKYIRWRTLAKRDFCPPGWIHEVDGPQTNEGGMVTAELGGKIPADVCKALLGAAYVAGGKGLQPTLDAAQRLHIPLQLGSIDEVAAGSVLSRILTGRSSSGPLTILGHEFNDSAKAQSVLQIPPKAPLFEKYSFLGNAALELLIIDDLWEAATLTPSELTIMKHSRMSLAALSALAVSSGAVDMMTVAPDYEGRFNAYIAEMRRAEALADAQDETEFWTQAHEFKHIGAAFQALFGVIAEDCGFDLPTLRKLYVDHMRRWMSKFGSHPVGSRIDARTKLQQFLQVKGCRDWSVQRGAGQYGSKRVTDVLVHGKEVGHGVGLSIAQAIETACTDALERLPSQIEVLCDCRHAR